jgi:prepilin-type N-terminal cleavage/methylation domain-containing protein
MPSERKAQLGFTLVELLVVIAIIGVLVALLLPAVQAAREAARRAQCQNQMKQIGLALQNHHDARGQLPAGKFWYNKDETGGTANFSGWGWLPHILPYMELTQLYDRANFDHSPNSNGAGVFNRAVIQTDVPGLICPSNSYRSEASDNENAGRIYEGMADSRKQIAEADYAANIGDYRNIGGTGDGLDHTVDGDGDGRADWPQAGNVFGPGTAQSPPYSPRHPTRGILNRFGWGAEFKQIPDGLSNTFAVGECVGVWCLTQNFGTQSWSTTAQPINHMNAFYLGGTQNWPKLDNPQWSDSIAFRSLHPGGAHFIMCDASVHFVNENVDHSSYRALASREGEDSIQGGLQ